ncbi:MAG: DUF2065 domain-containing protein [Steroidobacteraceae bacterium]
MGLDWKDLFAALAIVLVVEGVMPFANPAGMKRTLARLASMDERELRLGGLFSMAVGVGLLFWVRS